MKKTWLLTIVVLVLLTGSAFADTTVDIVIDGETVSSKGFLSNDTVMIPIGEIGPHIGTTVTWQPENRTLRLETNDHTLYLPIDAYVGVQDGTNQYLTEAPRIVDSRAYIPVEALEFYYIESFTNEKKEHTLYITSNPFYNFSKAIVDEFESKYPVLNQGIDTWTENAYSLDTSTSITIKDFQVIDEANIDSYMAAIKADPDAFLFTANANLTVDRSNKVYEYTMKAKKTLFDDHEERTTHSKLVNGQINYSVEGGINEFVQIANYSHLYEVSKTVVMHQLIDDEQIREIKSDDAKKVYELIYQAPYDDAEFDGIIGSELVGYFDLDSSDIQIESIEHKLHLNDNKALVKNQSTIEFSVRDSAIITYLIIDHTEIYTPTH